jgi:hypothetical protein
VETFYVAGLAIHSPPMLQVEIANIEIGAQAQSKEEAIRLVAGLLVRSGCLEPGYAESMLARERVANTFLGQGVAIPHGLPKDRELIRRTGIAVLQVPGGGVWQASPGLAIGPLLLLRQRKIVVAVRGLVKSKRRRRMKKGPPAVTVTLNPALLARPPRVTVPSTVGAGDAMVAGILYAMISEKSLEDVSRMAAEALKKTAAVNGAQTAGDISGLI